MPSGAERDERVDAPAREQQADRAAGHGDDPLSVRSCWTIAPRLAPSAVRSAISLRRDRRARQQQVGDVRARDQQHEADGAEQHEQGAAGVADDLVLQRPHRGRRTPLR